MQWRSQYDLISVKDILDGTPLSDTGLASESMQNAVKSQRYSVYNSGSGSIFAGFFSLPAASSFFSHSKFFPEALSCHLR
jgi:hypothetical protein